MHQALYRKWRPQRFEDVCGQEHVTSILQYQTKTGGLSHAYLFCGSRGTGKTTCAKILAKAVEDAVVSPISEAFRIVRDERHDINLYHTDKHHQSVYGSYLKSCVNYLVLYGKPFGNSPADCNLDPQVTAYLRSVAERVVLK